MKLSIHTFATHSEQEVAGEAEAMEQVFQSWVHISLTENYIHLLHRDLLRHSDKDKRHWWVSITILPTVVTFAAQERQTGVVFEPGFAPL